MVDIREVLLTWTIGNSPGGTTVLYTDPGVSVATQALAFGGFFGSTQENYSNTTSVRLATEGRVIDDETGTLTGTWSGGPGGVMTGSSTAEAVPNASQALVRMETAAVVAGRLLKGRMFLPGLSSDCLLNGELTEVARLDIQSRFNVEMIPGFGLLIWSRPFAGSVGPPARPPRAGSSSAVNSGSVWNEYAILRNRR